MRDVLGLQHPHRLSPASVLRGKGAACALALVLALFAAVLTWADPRLPAAGARVPATAAAAAHRTGHSSHHRTRAHGKRHRHRRLPFSRSKRRRAADLRRQALRHPTLTLKSSFIHRAQATSMVMPFTVRLRRSYEGGPGDDILQLSWDASAVPWPLDGTAPADPMTSNLDGALTYEWDYGADTSGYAEQGTVETSLGADISLQGTGFDIAVAGADPCQTTQSVTATGMALTAAGARFGTVNPFSGAVSGTLSFRTAIRTDSTPCGGGTPLTAETTSASPDPPLPVAFTGHFTVSPAITTDGHFRLGILTVDDSTTPQRTTFGLVYACTNPAAADGCDRKAFPVRTKLKSFSAEVIAGDVMPGPPSIPAPASTTTPSTTTTTSTSTVAGTALGDPAAAVLGP